ncbi:M10 family metallopeptidase C-terminal domain-containing protein [Pseudomonas brassicacearum]|uniref:M10 family metallopeptidase C-terminal domain-containing protein n=1 Tax=Pseudomonas brassicacearum TaxID=930166 RepID=UPI001DCA420B|nr:type I secretion target [Pseudomonas brassicacearum]CAH0137607.1 Poly(beta-D-mannuronate) C5 epimerase 1 [Pseudomonas brassicacearum]
MTSSNISASAALRAGTGKTFVDLEGYNDTAKIAVGPDGKIWLAGMTWVETGQFEYEGYRTSLVRLDADGTIDTTFSDDGKALLPRDIYPGQGYSAAVQADGKFLIVHPHFSAPTIVMVRLNTDGSVDQSFGVNGTATAPAAWGDSASATVQPDGKILVSNHDSYDHRFSVNRFNADGTVDSSFNGGNAVEFTVPDVNTLEGFGLTLQADGKILVPGYNGAFVVARLNPDGSLDTSFGTDGTADIEVAGLAKSITVQGDGKILVAGYNEQDATGYDFKIIRLNQDGTFDTSFGNEGVAVFDLAGGRDTARDITVLADGKILVAGQSNYFGNTDFSIIRLNPDGTLDTTFGALAGVLPQIAGGVGDDALHGSYVPEHLSGHDGNDLLDGGGQRDVLEGGTGADVFRITSIGDSYRTDTQAFSDRIVDFDANQDRIDLSSLGFSGLGNGLDATLAVQVNDTGTRTYLKSFEPDGQGNRFELVLDGDLAQALNETNLVFAQSLIQGTESADRLVGSAVGDVLLAGGGNDVVSGGSGYDLLEGGLGRDVLNGGEGADVFRYESSEDSFRTADGNFQDRIIDFDPDTDKIDVSALGFTELGNGYNSTLKAVLSEDGQRTYLKSYSADEQGHRFEITLEGDVASQLRSDNFIFASGDEPFSELQLLGVSAPEQFG